MLAGSTGRDLRPRKNSHEKQLIKGHLHGDASVKGERKKLVVSIESEDENETSNEEQHDVRKSEEDEFDCMISSFSQFSLSLMDQNMTEIYARCNGDVLPWCDEFCHRTSPWITFDNGTAADEALFHQMSPLLNETERKQFLVDDIRELKNVAKLASDLANAKVSWVTTVPPLINYCRPDRGGGVFIYCFYRNLCMQNMRQDILMLLIWAKSARKH